MVDTAHREIRHERPGDEAAIRRVNDEAFGQPDESRIIDAIREDSKAAISLVAVDRKRIVGHILFTPVAIHSQGSVVRALGLGPMAVAPGVQRQGIGSILVEAGLRESARQGWHAVVVLGHPEFYPRFGFRPGATYGLRSDFDVPEDLFMVLELTAGALAGVAGAVRYLPQFGSAGPDTV